MKNILLWIIIATSMKLSIIIGQNQCLQGENCVLPNCYCSTTKHHLPVAEIPQLVYFAFDDEIDSTVGNHYERLFHPSRKNQNGCPITMTMFATNKSTEYHIMDKLFSMGMEIGIHNSIQMTDKETIFNETRLQKEYIGGKSTIPQESLVGYRSPYLATAGDDQVDVLRQNGFKYDISYTYTRRPESGLNIWPFTLDFGWTYPCNINPCPKRSHNGFWEVPINSMWDYTLTDICAYADSCTHTPPSANEILNYLWSNFNNSYSKNKAPFGLHLHGRWLNDGIRLWAVDKFIRELLKLPDVYIVSVEKMLQWLQNPVRLNEIKTFSPWKCTKHQSAFMPLLQPLPERCEQGINCHLPDCFCDHFRHPKPKKDIPQMVYFAFDGPIDGTVVRYFQTLFGQSRRNPNKCPLRFNIFLSHTNTDYNHVQELYNSGAEIGTNGLGNNYLATRNSVLDEATKMIQNIVLKTNIPKTEIKGFRSPYLSTAGDKMIEALKEAGYSYDISYTFTRRPVNAFDAWPITLDYGWPYICNIAPCPEKTHKGFWEVPVNSLYDWTQSDFCTYADECRNKPNSEDETYQYLMDNFLNSYKGNRAPFGVHLHPRWFHIHRNLRAVNTFIEALLKMKDVYIVSVSDVIAWVKNPVSLDSINSFSGWKCRSVTSAMPMPQIPKPLECKNDINCKLPNCFCATLEHSMAKSDIPQMVYFAFDDNVNLKYSGYYFNLFGQPRLNPNNCSMTFTLFTIDKGTDYSFVEYFHQQGQEIASHGANNLPTVSKTLVLTEAGSQKQNIIDKSNVTAAEIIGFRSPQLSTAGDDQTDVLQQLGYKYDASYTFTRRPETGKNAWPFTADYGWSHDCNIPPCPYSSHKGFWYIPVNSMWDYKTEDICTFADECKNQPPTEKDVYNYLWNNFQNSYTGNRAPFGIHMQPMWLNDIKNLIGLRHFLDNIASLDDVYVVSISKVIEWMKHPTRLQDIKRFRPWSCSATQFYNDNSITGSSHTSDIETPKHSVSDRTSTVNHLPLSIEKQSRSDPVPTKMIFKPDSAMGVPIMMSLSKTSNTKASSSVLRSKDIETQINIFSRKEKTGLILTENISAIKESQLNIGECIQGQSCSLPHCFCQGKTIPLNLPKLSTPQMVFLSFDGTLNHADHGPYLNLLGQKKNPNNCSISATFFVNQVGSNITAIKDMYDRGYEIAMRGYNVLRPSNASLLESEIANQKSELGRHGITNISGWKTVGYTEVSNEFKDVLKKYNFRYDSTNYYDNNNNLWPFTLDFGPSNHSLLWEIPNLALTDYLNVYQCQYADGCFHSPTSVNATYNFLWKNFQKHYITGNKAPFGISFRKTWLSHAFYNDNLEGLKLFLDVILNFGDVYVVSTRQVMEWMEDPISFTGIPNSQLWTCKN